MKVVKTLALAALAAILATAFAGGETALATTICKEVTKKSEEKCPTPYPEQFEFKAALQTGKKAEFTAGAITVACTESGLHGEVSENPVAGKIPGQVKALTFSGCTTSGVGCSVGALHLPYSAQILSVPEPLGNGRLRLGEEEKGPPGLTISCAFFVPVICTFEIEEGAELLIAGGTPATIVASKVPLKLLTGSKACAGEEPRWSGQYEITEAGGTKKPPLFVVPGA